MLNKEQMNIIDKYVDEIYFDKQKLIKYLDMHRMVGNEIFSYCDRRRYNGGEQAYSSWLDTEEGYYPLYRDSFIERIPFYFYVWNKEKGTHSGTLHNMISYCTLENDLDSLEDLYIELKYLFYEKKISIYNIFNYLIEQTEVVDNKFFSYWIDYLHLCDELGWKDIMPERLITAYNYALEEAGKQPIVYKVFDIGADNIYIRDGMFLQFDGIFPCDEDGKPIMKWIGLHIINEKNISCNCRKSEDASLFVEISPYTAIEAMIEYKEGDIWEEVYTGPQNMRFDYTILKYQRQRLGLTQKEVAEAIGANVRTYQKWETGKTVPDGHYLLRLINWLDIPSVQNTIKCTVKF